MNCANLSALAWFALVALVAACGTLLGWLACEVVSRALTRRRTIATVHAIASAYGARVERLPAAPRLTRIARILANHEFRPSYPARRRGEP